MNLLRCDLFVTGGMDVKINFLNESGTSKSNTAFIHLYGKLYVHEAIEFRHFFLSV